MLFYFGLFISEDTPPFFAIDNIDASLNPKLCRRLIKELVNLANKYDKPVIFTTHNPAILDGLNLNDDEQRLFKWRLFSRYWTKNGNLLIYGHAYQSYIYKKTIGYQKISFFVRN